MNDPVASCCCGALRALPSTPPVRVSMCHCTACQRRTGSVFGVQARSVYEDRMHPWVGLPPEIEHMA